jgi:Tol biopolymer transport system component
MQTQDRPNSSIYVMGIDGMGATNISPDDLNAQSPSWSQDGQLISFAANKPNSDDFEIYTISIDGKNLTKLANASGKNLNPSWSFQAMENMSDELFYEKKEAE